MRMSDFVVREAIVPDLAATTKEGVIREMVESLRAAGYFKNHRSGRHRQGNPQAGIAGLDRHRPRGGHSPHQAQQRGPTGGHGRPVAPGVTFDSLDGEPVHVFVLLISPQDRPGDHLRALENVSRSLRDDGFVRSLRQAQNR